MYFLKWYLKGLRGSLIRFKVVVIKFVNLDFRMYLRFFKWMLEVLRMLEFEFIEYVGFDFVVYIRIYFLG